MASRLARPLLSTTTIIRSPLIRPEDATRRIADRFLTPAAQASDAVAHRLELVVAARLRECALEVPPQFEAAERRAAVTSLLAPAVLDRIRQACDGRIMVMKGPEVAAHYPLPTLRAYDDLDILVEDAKGVQDSLLASGFRPVGSPERYRGIHHLRPLALPGVPLRVEVHARPKWIEGVRPPAVEDLLEAAVPSASSVEGIEAPAPPHHALLLAAHSWAHEPLRRLRDVLDIWCVAYACDPDEIAASASRFDVERLWSTTRRVTAAVVAERPLPLPFRLWARNLQVGRERTVLEGHLEDWLSGFAALPPRRAVHALRAPLRRVFLPDREPARQKVRRSVAAVRDARRRRSEHDAAVERLLPPRFGG
jgi:hypothetical protein